MRCQKHCSHRIPQVTIVYLQSDGKYNFRKNSAVGKRQKSLRLILLNSVGRIQHGRALPSFDIMQLIYWLYIDDYAGCTLVDRETPAGASKAAGYAERARRRLEDTGLSPHKEVVG